MKGKPTYRISSGGITVQFAADQIKPSQRKRLAEELTDLNNAESLTTEEFLSSHDLNVGTYTLLEYHFPTIGDLARASDKQLLSVRGFGKRRLYFLREALRKEGY